VADRPYERKRLRPTCHAFRRFLIEHTGPALAGEFAKAAKKPGRNASREALEGYRMSS
jgi:hypothetical protein